MTEILFSKLSQMGERTATPTAEDQVWFWIIDQTQADPANKNKYMDYVNVVKNIGTNQILNGAITGLKLAPDCVDGSKVADDSIDSEHIAAGAIDLEHLAVDFLLPYNKIDGINTDPGADRIVFFDDSATSLKYLGLGAGLSITDTTLNANLPAVVDWEANQLGAHYIHGNNLPLQANTWLTAGEGITIDGRTISAGITEGQIADNAITNEKLRDSSALSVIGRAINSAGDPADIVAGADGYVLRRSGTTLAFGQVSSAGIANGAIIAGKIAAGGVSATTQIADGIITPAKLINQPTIINVRVFDENTVVSGGTNKAQIFVPYDVDGAVLSKADIGVVTCSTAEAISVQVYRLDTSANILSTAASLPINIYNTCVGGTRGAGSTAVTKGQRLRIDVTYAGSTAKGLDVQLVFVK
jgi:hypothetical protein